MNILIISYEDSITESITKVIEKRCKGANFDIVEDAEKARYYSSIQVYDLIVIDMMIQEYNGEIIKPILIPAINFLKLLKLKTPLTKVFALFDESETGKKGQNEISTLGYEVAAYESLSMEWEEKLLNYI